MYKVLGSGSIETDEPGSDMDAVFISGATDASVSATPFSFTTSSSKSLAFGLSFKKTSTVSSGISYTSSPTFYVKVFGSFISTIIYY